MFPQGASLFDFASGIDFQSEVYVAFFAPTVTSSKPPFYCVTTKRVKEVRRWQFSGESEIRAIP